MGNGYPSDWDSRRKKVYRRDNHRCQKCGARGGRRGNAELHAHHKTPKADGGSHRLRNLTTVCKQCHADIHGHGVGGRTSRGGSPDQSDEIDPVATAISVLLVGLIVFLYITHGAVQQTLPAGQTVSEEYTLDYGSNTEDPDGRGRDIEYDVGAPITIQYQLSDNVISETGETQLTVTIHNPSNNYLRGQLDVIGRSSYALKGSLGTVNFDLSSDESTTESLTLPGEPLVANAGLNPRTVTFNAEGMIFTDPYNEIDTTRSSLRDDEMKLTVRKPFFNRFGVYWLGFLTLIVVGVGYLAWKNRR